MLFFFRPFISVLKIYQFPGVVHLTHEGHGYLFSWEDPRTSELELSWMEAREFCQTHCMDLVGLETQEENILVKERLAKGNQSYAWTGGRKCNFEGCDRPDLKPVSVYGWFWVGSHKKLPPTTNRLDADWSNTGGLGVPQPDDREHRGGGPSEDCLAILNNLHSDGIHWHDIACNHRKPFICEDSDIVPHDARSEVPQLPVDMLFVWAT
ncbi:L-selectin-like [Anabrus simplex]|uniref:L-selectin-like n=1 Tax=Anabrus simplex TaxID=316456 RepID=UPI0035A270A2